MCGLGSLSSVIHLPPNDNLKTGEVRGRPYGSRRRLRKQARRMTSRSSLEEEGKRLGLKDLATGLYACIEILTEGNTNDDSLKLNRWATALMRHVSRGVGTHQALLRAKSYFACCRANAINLTENWGDQPPVPKTSLCIKSRRRVLHQISRVSRSLREATPEMVEASLKSHREISQCYFETPVELRSKFRRFLRRHFGGDAGGSLGACGSSASFLRKSHEGGSAAEVREITDRFRAKEVSLLDLQELVAKIPEFISSIAKVVDWRAGFFSLEPRHRVGGRLPHFKLEDVLFPYDRESGLSLEDHELTRELLFSMTAAWFEIDFESLPRCRQIAVKERGLKVRVATPIEASDRYLLSLVNSALLSKLEELPQVVSALHGCPAEKLDWSVGRKYHLVFSADLKSATDYLPQDLMTDAADVISENWPEGLRRLFLRSVGPHVMISPGGDGAWVTNRGILMGSPVSWPLLSMYSAWLHSESGSDGWYAVCGDDYVGCHTQRSYRKYLSVRTATGAVGSPGKDILGCESTGVFAEELLTVGRNRWIPTVSVRAVLADPKSGVPAWSQGPEVSNALRRVFSDATTMTRVCERLHGGVICRFRKFKIDPFAPRWIGGAGFPGTPYQSSLQLARMLISQSQEQIIKWITEFEMAWSSTANDPRLGERVEADLKRNGELLNWDSGRDGEFGPLRDVVSSRLGSLSWPYYLAGACKRERRVVLPTVARRVTAVKDEIAFRGYWVDRSEVIVRGEGIAERLDSLEPLIRPPPFTPFLRKLLLFGVSRKSLEPFRARKAPTGPGSPGWGPRKRRRLV